MDKPIFGAIVLGIIFSFVIFSTFSSLPLVSAANISISNFSNLSTTVSITCGFTGTDGMERNVYNASIYYNDSVNTVGTTGLPGAGTLLTTITSNDTLTNTTFTNSSVSLASLTEEVRTYSFWCVAHNQTTFTGNSTSHGNSTAAMNITIDNTAPSKLEIYTTTFDNATAKKNTDHLILNISVTDGLSLSAESACVINVNTTAGASTNQTVPLIMDSGSTTTGTCNSSVINLTGSADNVYLMEIYVNDTANNLVRNNTNRLYLVIDTSVPIASATCSPTTVQVGDSFPCSCSGSDATSGVNSTSGSTTSPDGTVSPSSTGSFTYTCLVMDDAGNSITSTKTYLVTQSPGSGTSSGGGTTISSWTTGTTITASELETGYTQSLGEKHRIKFQFESESHHVGVVSVSTEKATIEIASDPVQVILSVGEDAKIDITGDGFYDIYVILNEITNNKADITIKKIHEEIPEGEGGVGTSGEIVGGEAEKNLTWLWIVIGVVVLAIIIGGGKALRKKQ